MPVSKSNKALWHRNDTSTNRPGVQINQIFKTDAIIMSLEYFRSVPNTNYSLVFFVKNLLSTNLSRPLKLLISRPLIIKLYCVSYSSKHSKRKKDIYQVCGRRLRNIIVKVHPDGHKFERVERFPYAITMITAVDCKDIGEIGKRLGPATAAFRE